MVDYNRLILILKKELECQRKLLDVMSRERDALVSFDADIVSEIAEEKKGILEYGKALQEKRLSALGPNSAEEPRKVKLDDVISGCASPQLKHELKTIHQELKKIVDEVKHLHDHNGQLFKMSLGFISSTLSIISSKPEAELPTYGLNAKLTAGNGVQDPAFVSHSKAIVRVA